MGMFSRDRRVIVIGAGSSGLVAAIHLARAGLEVTVLEHNAEPGGASRSTAATLPGFVHDHCAGFNPMTVASPAFQELELEREGLRWITPDVVMAHPFADGSAIQLRRSPEETAESLNAVTPGSGAAWTELVNRLAPVTDQLVSSVLGPLAMRPDPAAVALKLRGDTLRLARYMIGSIQALGLDIFAGAPRPTAWLAGTAQHSGLPPSTAGSGAFGLLLQLLAHRHGWPFPEGGQQAVTDALLRIGAREGVSVRCGAHVEHIETADGHVRGVTLTGGEQIGARAIVSTVSARPLARMLPPDALPGRLTRRLDHWRYGTAAFKIDYALDAPVPWSAPGAAEASVIHVAGELHDFTVAAQAATAGDVPEAPALVIGQHTPFDPTRAPAGQHTLYCYAHVPADYRCGDAEIVSRIEAQLERFAPGFAATVLARSTRNPRQTEADNPSLVDGDLGGGVLELDQQLIFRPAPEMCRYRTPLPGLYVAGASVHPGGSVQGMGGRSAARALIADRRLRPWRA